MLQSAYEEHVERANDHVDPLKHKKTSEQRTADRKRRQEKAERRKLREQTELEDNDDWQDDDFFYIAGYTPGGVPYGVTLEEMGDELKQVPDIDDRCEATSDELPFD